MLRRLLLAFTVALFGLAPNISAQCSDLDIQTRQDPSGSFQIVRIIITSTLSEAPHALVLSMAPGKTILDLGGSELVLGLEAPMRVVRLGPSDSNGQLVRFMRVPPDLDVVLYTQSVGFWLGLNDG